MARRPIAGGLFLNHGEDEARHRLVELLVEAGLDPDLIRLPALDEVFELHAGAPESKGRAAERIEQGELAVDWNDRFEELVLSIERELEAAPDAEARDRILRALEGTLNRA